MLDTAGSGGVLHVPVGGRCVRESILSQNLESDFEIRFPLERTPLQCFVDRKLSWRITHPAIVIKGILFSGSDSPTSLQDSWFSGGLGGKWHFFIPGIHRYLSINATLVSEHILMELSKRRRPKSHIGNSLEAVENTRAHATSTPLIPTNTYRTYPTQKKCSI